MTRPSGEIVSKVKKWNWKSQTVSAVYVSQISQKTASCEQLTGCQQQTVVKQGGSQVWIWVMYSEWMWSRAQLKINTHSVTFPRINKGWKGGRQHVIKCFSSGKNWQNNRTSFSFRSRELICITHTHADSGYTWRCTHRYQNTQSHWGPLFLLMQLIRRALPWQLGAPLIIMHWIWSTRHGSPR